MISCGTYLEVEGPWLRGILELGFLRALLEKCIKLREHSNVSPHKIIRYLRQSKTTRRAVVYFRIDMASYLEKLVVSGLSFQLLAVGDCLLELGGLDDHGGGVSFSMLEYP